MNQLQEDPEGGYPNLLMEVFIIVGGITLGVWAILQIIKFFT